MILGHRSIKSHFLYESKGKPVGLQSCSDHLCCGETAALGHWEIPAALSGLLNYSKLTSNALPFLSLWTLLAPLTGRMRANFQVLLWH